MQDIVPKGRSIRNVPVPESRTKSSLRKEEKEIVLREKTLKKDIEAKEEANSRLREDIEEEKTELAEDAEKKEALQRAREEFEESRRRRTKRSKTTRRGLMYGIGAVVFLILLVILFSTVWKSATVTVTPRTYAFTANTDITAKRVAAIGELPFKVVNATSTASETIRATGQKQVDTQATGTIVIYNNYSSALQRLIKNTRFATPEGLIFRVSDSVTVPGKKGTTPGSIEATVVADESGANYNIGLKDFTIPGFKGDPRYAGFYARSKTPMTGGFSGIQKIVADADRAKAKSDIETKLAADLLKQARGAESASDISFDKAYQVSYSVLPDEVSGDQVTVKEQGAISMAVFDRKQLSSALAKALVSGYKSESINVPGLENLSFTPTVDKSLDLDSISAFSFHISGSGTFEWLYDETALKTALKGQPRSAVPAILQKFPMISKADIAVRPFWSGSFPGSVSKIDIKKAQ